MVFRKQQLLLRQMMRRRGQGRTQLVNPEDLSSRKARGKWSSRFAAESDYLSPPAHSPKHKNLFFSTTTFTKIHLPHPQCRNLTYELFDFLTWKKQARCEANLARDVSSGHCHRLSGMPWTPALLPDHPQLIFVLHSQPSGLPIPSQHCRKGKSRWPRSDGDPV